MDRRDVLPIHLVGNYYFVCRIQSDLYWHTNFIVLSLEVCVKTHRDHMEPFTDEILLLVAHNV